jgi:uncharacterized protein YndB with AHSA1/START domain
MPRFVKVIVLVLAAVGALLFLGGLALPGRFHIERSVVSSAPPAKAYALVADPHHWKQWTVWNRRDPAMAITYFGNPAGANSGWAWQSKTEGDGKMTLTAVTSDQRVAYDLYFPDMDSTSTGELRFEPAAAGTRITWTMDGDMGANPLMHWMALMMDRMVGPDFEGGLANLKALAEQP